MRKNRYRAKIPIIAPSAVEEFLSRPLDNYDFLKQAPKQELLDHAHANGHRFATDCWHNQLVCFNIGMELQEFLFFLKMGGGKSKLILDLIRYRKRKGQLIRALVLAPELLHVASWEEQVRTHAPDLKYRLLLGEKSERIEMLDRPSDLCIMNYKGLEVYMSKRQKVVGKDRNKQQIDPALASAFASKFNFVAFDESHRLGNHQSLLFGMCQWVAAAADFRYALTGTPFGRDPSRLWPQFKLIDGGQTLGQRLGLFRAAFFTAKEDYWSGIKYTFNSHRLPDLHRVIKHRSITYELVELRDMPRKVPIRIPVRMTGEISAYYNRIIAGVREARGDYQSLGNLFVRMRQCASGFLAMRADDESRIEVQFKDNPKLEALREFVLDKEDKILVFHEFIISGQMVEQVLTAAKIGYASLRGGTKNPAEEYGRFLRDPKCRVFVLNNRLGSEAINPQYVCRRAVFYESPVDPVQREQAEGRVHRPGQKWTTFIYDLLVAGTVEEKVLRYVREGRDLLRAVLSGDGDLLDEETDGDLHKARTV